MIRGMYTAAMGMLNDMALLNQISNDLANVDTPGYRSDRLAFKTFLDRVIYSLNPDPRRGRVMKKPVGVLEGAVVVDEVRPDMSRGALEMTGGPLDLAIDGGGFFAVELNGKVLYTRAGNFKLDGEGYVVTPDGARLLDESGKPVKFSKGYRITEDRWVRDENGNGVARIAVYDFDSPEKLVKYGYTYFMESDESGKPKPVDVGVRVGYIERSNVNALREMVNMIKALRHFEVAQRVITTSDELLGRLMNSVGTLR